MRALAKVSLIVCLFVSLATSALAEVKVFKDFTLIDGSGGPAAVHSAMILNNGRIQWVGPEAQLKGPAFAQVFDLHGKYVIPGLIDTHVHLSEAVDLQQSANFMTEQNVERDLRTLASYGVTAVLSLGIDKDFVLKMRDEQRATGRPREARIFSAGQGLVFKGGMGGLPGVNQQVATDAQARVAVDAQAAKHVDFIKLWMDDKFGTLPKMPYSMAQAIIDQAHKDRLRVIAHIFYLKDAMQLVGYGVNGLAHSVRDQPVSPAFIQAMKQHGVWQEAATLSREASMFVFGQNPAFLHDPFFTRGVSQAVVKTLESPAYQQSIRSNPLYTRKFPQVLANAKKNLKVEVDAGIPYGCGTDSGAAGRFLGYSMHWEMALMVEAGLTPTQALTACTLNNAEFLHAQDLGTIQAGKWGDFVVLHKNPLEDILNTRTIDAVYIAGNRFR